MFHPLTGELKDPTAEKAFQQEAWPRNRLFSRTLFGATALIVSGMIGVNLTDPAIGKELLILFIPLRLLQISSCLYVFFLSFRTKRPASYDKAILVAQLVTLLVELCNDALTDMPRATEATPGMPFIVVILFVFYTLVPSRFGYTIAYGVLTTVLFSITASYFYPTIGYMLLMFLFVNLIGIAYGRFLNRLQRQDYLQRAEIERVSDERHKAEQEALSSKAIAERASKQKSRFIAVASHDLRQPLHAMGLWIDTLQHQLSGSEDGKVMDTVSHLIRAKDGLDSLLDRLLHVSHLDSGTTVVKRATISAEELLAGVDSRFREAAKASQVSLVLRPGRRLAMISDPVLLARILDNLTDNAIKYTPAGGRILLAVRRSGDDLRVQVWNTGSYISEEDQQQIFDEFHQVGELRGQAVRGLGLGLSIVRRLSELLAHRIVVFSFASGLTCFEVIVKATEPPTNPEPHSTTSLSPYENVANTILVIDDDPEILAAMRQLLERWQFTVQTASTGDEARSHVKAAQPDAILSDLHLGGEESGIDVVRDLIQGLEPAPGVLLMSGETSAETLKSADATGYTLVTKPVKPASLRIMLSRLLAPT